MPVEGLLLCASGPSQPARLPPSFWLLHCAKCSLPSHSVLRSLQDQARVARPPGTSIGSLLTPGMPPGWILLSVEQIGLIQSFCPDPNLQDPGQPSRPLHLMLPASPQLHLPHLCRGKGCVFNKPLACFLGLPQGKGAFGQPQTWLLSPKPPYPLPSIEGLCVLGPPP